LPAVIDLPVARGLLARAVLTQGPSFVYSATEPGDGTSSTCLNAPVTDELLEMLGQEVDSIPADDPRRRTGCLIGVALTLHGETRHLVQRWVGSSVGTIQEGIPGLMTYAARRYFSEAQEAQDGGATWGDAYDRAETSWTT